MNIKFTRSLLTFVLSLNVLVCFLSLFVGSSILAETCVQRPPASYFDSLVFKSSDGGSTSAVLADLSTDFVAHIVNRIIVDPFERSTIYLGTNGGVFKSANGGCSWTESNSGLIDRYVRDLVANPMTHGNLYAITVEDAGNLYSVPPSHRFASTTNGGNNWKSVSFDDQLTCLAMDPSNPTTIYLGAKSQGVLGLYKSTDGGNTFSFARQRDNASDFSIDYIVVDPKDPLTLYYGSNNSTGSALNRLGGVYKSTDGGLTSALVFHPSDTVYTRSLVIDPQDTSIIYELGRGFYKSTDGGTSWANVSLVSGLFLTMDSSSNLFAALTPELVCGGLYGCGGNLARSSDGGRTWSKLAGLSNAPFAIDPVDPLTLYGSNYIPPPPLTRVSIKGKKVVMGGFFHEGAVIKINGEEQKTEMRPHAQGDFYVELVSKKGARNVAPGQVVPVSVEEVDGVEVTGLGHRLN